jgi:hypothetical protein
MSHSNRTIPKTLFAAALLTATGLGCSTTIHGVVRDKPTGNPLSSASVAIGEANATTNAMGAYTLEARVKPSSVLVINAPGYFMYSASVAKRGDEGSELVRDVELAPRSEMATRK